MPCCLAGAIRSTREVWTDAALRVTVASIGFPYDSAINLAHAFVVFPFLWHCEAFSKVNTQRSWVASTVHLTIVLCQSVPVT